MIDAKQSAIAEFKNLRVEFETKDGTVVGVEDVTFFGQARRNGLHCRRVGLRKIGVLTLDDASCRVWWR